MFTDDDFARDELHGVEPQLRAAEKALAELLHTLGELQGWRASSILTAVIAALDELTFLAWDLPALPADYLVWRERFWNDGCPL